MHGVPLYCLFYIDPMFENRPLHLLRAGTTGQNFYLICINTLASAFLPIKVARSPAVMKLL